MGSQQLPLAALFLLGVLGEYPRWGVCRGTWAQGTGRKCQFFPWPVSGARTVTSLEHPGGLWPPGSLSATADCRSCWALGPLVPPLVPQLCFSLAPLGASLYPARQDP